MRHLLPVLAFSLIGTAAHACSCMGNSSYCETLSAEWWDNPDATALVVKLSDVHYGITVKVLQTFDGTALPADTLTVWGDNGGLCRIYLNGIAVGDTIVFGLDVSDLSGNTMWNPDFPPDLEEEGDYMVSGCGVHALNYSNGVISGPISGAATEQLTFAEFETAIASCSGTTGVVEHVADPLLVRYVDGAPLLEIPACERPVGLAVVDAQGRQVLSRRWDGQPLALNGFASGSYIVQVQSAQGRSVRKVVVH